MPTPNIIEIDSVTGFAGTSYSDFGPNQDLGPWFIGSKRYVGYMRSLPQVHPSPDLLYTAIASSADGITFTCHDQANAPGLRSLNLGPTGAVCLGNDGTTLYTAYADLSNNISIIPFNTATDLYGSILSGGPAVTSHVMISSLRMLSTGVLVVMYGIDEGAFGSLQIVTCTTLGVWGTPQTIASDGGTVHNIGMSSVPDSAGRTHLLYFTDDLNTGNKSISYALFDGAVVSNNVAVFGPNLTPDSPYHSSGTGYYDATNDRVLLPFIYDGILESGFGIIKVHPASTTSTLTVEFVGASDSNRLFPGITADTGNTTYYFTIQDYTTTEQLLRWERGANAVTVFFGPTTIWNWDTDPPAPDPSNPGSPAIEINPPSGLKPVGSKYGTLISFFGGGGSSTMQYCNTVFYLEVAGASSPTLACPVSNTFTVGVPYSGSLIESGGTGPFTYAIIGGALPPGLSLNATTGVISGTPTSAGDFSYTAQVTDANGLTATVGCVLSGSGVQPTTPCGQSVPVPSTDVKFELRRVYASMKPAPRLPVRGS